MGPTDQRLIASLLVSIFCIVLIVGTFLVYLVLRWRQLRTDEDLPRKRETKETGRGIVIEIPPLTLKRPTCWLAIKNRNLAAIQSALALHNPKPCSWFEGLSGESDERLFVSPPVSGWVLVIGSALPDPSDDVDVSFRFILELSQKLGHVQYFSANAMLNQHAWVRAENGRVVRGYAWADKTLWNQGDVTAAEQELAMKCYEYAELADSLQFGDSDANPTNSDKVHLLAARWSVDPEDLDQQFIEHEWGIVGEPSRRF